MLNESENIYCQMFRRVETRAKHGNTEILTKEIMQNLKLIISIRELAQIPATECCIFEESRGQAFRCVNSLKRNGS